MTFDNKQTTLLLIVAILIGLTCAVGAVAYFKYKSLGSQSQKIPAPNNKEALFSGEVETSEQQTDEESAQAPQEPRVAYTDGGYLPDPLIVKKGTTVTFENATGNPMWTASDQHPSHRLYPTRGGCLGSTFDACAGTSPGGSWSFTFDAAGSWNYHNHLNPANGGTIIVQE